MRGSCIGCNSDACVGVLDVSSAHLQKLHPGERAAGVIIRLRNTDCVSLPVLWAKFPVVRQHKGIPDFMQRSRVKTRLRNVFRCLTGNTNQLCFTFQGMLGNAAKLIRLQ